MASGLVLSNDGVVRDNLYVIKYTTTRMPDVLIEYAYISNRREDYLNSYQIAVDAGDGRFTTTIYPVAN